MEKREALGTFRRLVKSSEGQVLVEYAFVLLLVVIVLVAVVTSVGRSACNMYSSINSGITCAVNP
jgi:Flp pilus assembly pilin Flp